MDGHGGQDRFQERWILRLCCNVRRWADSIDDKYFFKAICWLIVLNWTSFCSVLCRDCWDALNRQNSWTSELSIVCQTEQSVSQQWTHSTEPTNLTDWTGRDYGYFERKGRWEEAIVAWLECGTQNDRTPRSKKVSHFEMLLYTVVFFGVSVSLSVCLSRK